MARPVIGSVEGQGSVRVLSPGCWKGPRLYPSLRAQRGVQPSPPLLLDVPAAEMSAVFDWLTFLPGQATLHAWGASILVLVNKRWFGRGSMSLTFQVSKNTIGTDRVEKGEPLVFDRIEFVSRRGWSVCLWVLLSGFMALGLALPVLNAAPQEQEKSSKAEKRRQKAIQKEMESPYKKWLTEEVPYIITSEERGAFKKLTTDDEREQFIESFWERRNPNPGSPENEFKEEYYRRIAYANEHYASGIQGWRTDRGRIYIMYGPADEVESHPSGGSYLRPQEEGG